MLFYKVLYRFSISESKCMYKIVEITMWWETQVISQIMPACLKIFSQINILNLL